MKKNIFKSSLIISAICALFSLSVFSYDHKKTMPVKADDEYQPYNYDYRYTLQYYEYSCIGNNINSTGNDTYGNQALFKFTYRMVLHYDDEVGDCLSFDNLNINHIYLKALYRSGANSVYYRLFNYDYSLGWALNDATFDYTDDLSFLANANHYYDIYVDGIYYYNTNALNVGLVFQKSGTNYGGSRRISCGVYENFDEFLTSSSGTLNSNIIFSVPLILGFNPLVIGNGIDTAIMTAYSDGVSGGAEEAWYNGYTQGKDDGFALGYSDGFSDGSSTDETAATIFSGILQIAMVPVNFFLAIFNFEILGINVSSFVSALLTIAVTVIIIRIITGKKDG